MYSAKIVELADRDGSYANPMHPYTQCAVVGCADPDPSVETQRKRIILRAMPSPANLPKGCISIALPADGHLPGLSREGPEFIEHTGHAGVACYLYEQARRTGRKRLSGNANCRVILTSLAGIRHLIMM